MSHLIRVNGAAEILAVVAHNLGFQPQHSLVLVSLREKGRVGLVARADLDAAPVTIQRLAAHAQDDGARRTVTIVYSDDSQRAEAVLAHAVAAQVPMLSEAIHVTSTGYRHPLDGEQFHPITDLETTVAGAAYVLLGSSILKTREDLAPGPASDKARHIAVTRAHTVPDDPDPIEAARAWIAAPGNDWSTTDAEHLGYLAGTLRNRRIRDAVLVRIFGGTEALTYAAAQGQDDDGIGRVIASVLDPTAEVPDMENRQWTDTLAAVISHTDGDAASVPILAVWAIVRWWVGDGASAAVATEKALALDPDHRLALLMHDILGAAIGPGWTRDRR